MKKMYFLKDRKEAVIDRLTYMSKHRQEYLQDKEHGMITLQFKQGTKPCQPQPYRLSEQI